MCRVCTVILLARPGDAWPLLIAANRDERLDRPWDPPAAYWREHPGVIAGQDRSGGGTWLGFNQHGVVAAVLNRPGSLGPAPGKRSRGELPLIALDHASAADAARAIRALDPGAWRSFNLVIADRTDAFFLKGDGEAQPCGDDRPECRRLAPGLHMVTAYDPDDFASPRVARHLPRFRAASPPIPPDWSSWRPLLADGDGRPEQQLHVRPIDGFGTVCSALIGIPEKGAAVMEFRPAVGFAASGASEAAAERFPRAGAMPGRVAPAENASPACPRAE